MKVMRPEIRNELPPYQKEFTKKSKKTKDSFQMMVEKEMEKLRDGKTRFQT